MLTEQRVLEILGLCGALVSGTHVVYASGKHGSCYVNKDAVYPHTGNISELCQAIAERFAHADVDAVLAPALGGIILSQWVAFHLSRIQGRNIHSVYAEKDASTQAFVIKRGYDKLIAGKKVLIVEDVLTTGGSVRQVVEAARYLGADILGVGALCNRGSVTPEQAGDVPVLVSLATINLEAWDPDHCPLCKEGQPVNTQLGKGREFLEARKKSRVDL